MDDGLVKFPKILRSMLFTLVEENSAQVNKISAVGFLMKGKRYKLCN
jgi:hypothetical protein